MPTGLWPRIRALLRIGAAGRDLDSELRFHLEEETRKHPAAGLPPEEAARRARISFGGLDAVREAGRDVRSAAPIQTVWRDVRYAVRILGRQ